MPDFTKFLQALSPAPFARIPFVVEKCEEDTDEFQLTLTKNTYDYISDAELFSLAGGTLVFDIESYVNYALIAFKVYQTNKVVVFVDDGVSKIDANKLAWILRNFLIVGYNSKSYDIVILALALRGANSALINQATNEIIVQEIKPYQMAKKYKMDLPSVNMIDLFDVAPLQGSLKLYAGRLHCKRMQDLPIEASARIAPEDREIVQLYCLNDLDNTELLALELTPQLNLRVSMSQQYGVDLRSKSDAQIAETVICSQLTKLLGQRPERPEIPPGNTFRYIVPDFITYTSEACNEMLQVVSNAVFEIASDGTVIMPSEIEQLSVALGSCVYRMGIGGLHSSEERTIYQVEKDELLIDRDVASYYPAIVINLGLTPLHLGAAFLDVYKTLVAQRLKAKQESNKIVADSLKITINGTFGKLGSKWSALYAPDLMIQVTLTGQLSLLMLIDMLEDAGIKVVSANTDGIVMKCLSTNDLTVQKVVEMWESLTGFVTEETSYKAMYMRDVNNYIAVKNDNKVKVKGAFSERGSAGDSGLSRNPECFICNDAVIALLTKQTPIEETIKACTDIRRFVTVRNVKGGAVKSGVYLGRVVRFYYSTQMQGVIRYKNSGNKVPLSDGAKPLMELPEELPTDIDYDAYITRAKSILVDIGYTPMPIKGFKPAFKRQGLFA